MADQTVAPIKHESLKERAIGELKAFLYITLYFWVLFLVFDLLRAATLKSEGLSVVNSSFAIVSALVLAKVALITESVYGKRQLGDMRLAYRVVAHALLLAVVLIAFSLLEEGIKSLMHGEGLGAHLDGTHFAYILGKSAVFFVMLLPFCAFQELARLLGSGPLVAMFFDPPAGQRYALVREEKA